MVEAIYDLRSFIKRLEAEGELARVKVEVDWKYELGAVTRRVLSEPPGPAVLFEKVKDYNTPVFIGGLRTSKRIAIALGLDSKTDEGTVVKEYAKRIEKPIKPVTIKSGPCKENKDFGKDVNLLKFPVPWWGEKDGGRYIGTWHQVIVKDPETGWTNVGTYRMMVHEPNICGIQFSPFQHIGMIYNKYRKMNHDMPIAITIGTDPVAMLVSASPFPAGVDEWDMAGALRGRPMEMVKCETCDLEVPSHTEIILEGQTLASDKRPEGPFGEHTGYYGAGIRPLPVVKFNCVTYRNNPILRGTTAGIPITEESQITSVMLATHAIAMYQSSGFPGVTAVSCPAGGDPWFSAIIAIIKSYPSQGLDAARMLLSSKVGKFTKHVIVVDNDINIFDLNQVLWAINTRLQAGRQVYITHNESGSRLDPSVREDMIGITDKMIMDATWTTTPEFPPRKDWGGESHPPKVETSKEMQEFIAKRWKEYGIN